MKHDDLAIISLYFINEFKVETSLNWNMLSNNVNNTYQCTVPVKNEDIYIWTFELWKIEPGVTPIYLLRD